MLARRYTFAPRTDRDFESTGRVIASPDGCVPDLRTPESADAPSPPGLLARWRFETSHGHDSCRDPLRVGKPLRTVYPPVQLRSRSSRNNTCTLHPSTHPLSQIRLKRIVLASVLLPQPAFRRGVRLQLVFASRLAIPDGQFTDRLTACSLALQFCQFFRDSSPSQGSEAALFGVGSGLTRGGGEF